MRSRMFIGTLLLVGAFVAGTVTTSGDGLPRGRQEAVVYLTEPTLIGSTIVQGPVLFAHDDARMARGEPCTKIYLFEPGKGPAEEITSFCKSEVFMSNAAPFGPIAELLERSLSIRHVYGEPVRHGETTVIPVAQSPTASGTGMPTGTGGG